MMLEHADDLFFPLDGDEGLHPGRLSFIGLHVMAAIVLALIVAFGAGACSDIVTPNCSARLPPNTPCHQPW